MPAPLIAALLYADGVYPDRLIARTVDALMAQGVVLAGMIERPPAEGIDRTRCDMLLQDLASGAIFPISHNRGPGARSCRLDPTGLTEAATAISRSLRAGTPRLLVLNKFGRTEAEGGGMRDAIAEALAREIPVLVGVPARNLDSWRAFAGPFAVELATDEIALATWLHSHGLHPDKPDRRPESIGTSRPDAGSPWMT